MWTLFAQSSRRAIWIIPVGTILLLIGLAWDAILHGLDRDLAAREGIFTVSNPGHALFTAGLALIVTGTLLLLAGQAAALAVGSPRRMLLHAAVYGIAALAVVSVGLGALDGSGFGSGHSHATPAVAASESCAVTTPHTHERDGAGHRHAGSIGHSHPKAATVSSVACAESSER